MRGKWEIVERVSDGEKVKYERTIWIIAGNTMRFGEEPDATTATLTLDPSKGPKTLEFQTKLPDGDGSKGVGIYFIEGDELKFCVSPDKGKRPTEFASKPNSGHVYTVLKRVN